MNIFKKKEQADLEIPLGHQGYNPERVKFAFQTLLNIAAMIPRGVDNGIDIDHIQSRSGIFSYEGQLCFDVMQELVRMKLYSYDKKLQVYYVEDR